MFPFRDNLRYLGKPTVTAVLIWVNCLVFLFQEVLTHLGAAGFIVAFGAFTPAQFTAAYAQADPLSIALATASVLTCLFLHGGVMHILGNMLFLNCFGRALEIQMGWKRYLCFYLIGGVAATAGQYAMEPTSSIPLLGASGAIAAVLSAYLVFWPKAKITLLSTAIGLVEARAFLFIGFWMAGQLLAVIFAHHEGTGGVAYMAHISGFAFGLLAGAWANKRCLDKRVFYAVR